MIFFLLHIPLKNNLFNFVHLHMFGCSSQNNNDITWLVQMQSWLVISEAYMQCRDLVEREIQ